MNQEYISPATQTDETQLRSKHDKLATYNERRGGIQKRWDNASLIGRVGLRFIGAVPGEKYRGSESDLPWQVKRLEQRIDRRANFSPAELAREDTLEHLDIIADKMWATRLSAEQPKATKALDLFYYNRTERVPDKHGRSGNILFDLDVTEDNRFADLSGKEVYLQAKLTPLSSAGRHDTKFLDQAGLVLQSVEGDISIPITESFFKKASSEELETIVEIASRISQVPTGNTQVSQYSTRIELGP